MGSTLRSLAILLAVAAASPAWGASPASETDLSNRARDPIVLGALFNMSGTQAEFDVPAARGAQLAVDMLNRRGNRLLGKRLELVIEDGKTIPRRLTRRTERILRRYPSVSAFLGLSDTDMVLAAAPPAAAAERVFLTSGATSPQLPGQVPEYLFLACFGDNEQAAVAAEYAYDALGARSADVLYDSTSTYTTLLQGYFRTRFEELGGTVAAVEPHLPGAAVTAIPRLPPADIVFVSSADQQDIESTISQLREAGLTGPILGGDAFDSEELWAAHPEIEDVYYTTHVYLGADSTDPAVVEFRSAYLAAYSGEPPNAFAALGYDAVNLLAEAIWRAGSSDPDQVLDSLSRVGDFVGVTGKIAYEGGSRIPRKSVSVIEVANGATSLAEQRLPIDFPPP